MQENNYSHTYYAEMLDHFAKQFSTKVKNNILELPPNIGVGYIKLINLPNGLQGLISDYVLSTDLQFNWDQKPADCFILRFDEVNMPDAILSSAESSNTAECMTIKSAVFLASTRFNWGFNCIKGSVVKGINIFLTKEWIVQFLNVDQEGDEILKYLNLRITALNHEHMNMEYKRLLKEIITASTDSIFHTMIIQNRVMLLLEKFFSDMFNKMKKQHFNPRFTNKEIEILTSIKNDLEEKFYEKPKSIEDLSKIASMSASKLKSSFKELFGLPIYQYHQKHRMYKAKSMLVSKKYGVTHVGTAVGYINISNFGKAFKKAFDQLPSDLL